MTGSAVIEPEFKTEEARAKAAEVERERQADAFGLVLSACWTKIREHVKYMAKTPKPRTYTINPEDWESAIVQRFGNVFK